MEGDYKGSLYLHSKKKKVIKLEKKLTKYPLDILQHFFNNVLWTVFGKNVQCCVFWGGPTHQHQSLIHLWSTPEGTSWFEACWQPQGLDSLPSWESIEFKIVSRIFIGESQGSILKLTVEVEGDKKTLTKNSCKLTGGWNEIYPGNSRFHKVFLKPFLATVQESNIWFVAPNVWKSFLNSCPYSQFKGKVERNIPRCQHDFKTHS